MSAIKNPFEYEAASKLTKEQVIEYFIDSYNYARFIKSKRNLFLVGERGAGKTMMLLHSSFPVQKANNERLGKSDSDLYEIVCIHIPCNTPLFYKKEYELLEQMPATVVSEHFLVLFILFFVADTFANSGVSVSTEHDENFRKEFEYITEMELPQGTLWEAVRQFTNREVKRAQNAINRLDVKYYHEPLTFASTVVPFLHAIRKLPGFTNSHFSLMFDDLHDLNEHQITTINSWVSFRDNSLFSFKIACAKVDRPTKLTSSGSTIIEGHDYLEIDLESEYQNPNVNFGKLAGEIISKRLHSQGITFSPEGYFPISPIFESHIDKCREEARKIAEEKISPVAENRNKKISDEVYKNARSIYFCSLKPKANVPGNAYTGFEQIVHLSTGIVRNLLKPCYYMFDDHKSENDPASPIPPEIQSKVILAQSIKLWDSMKHIDTQIDGCTKEMCGKIFQLFDKLCIHFRNRLEREGAADRRAVKFVITEKKHPQYEELLGLLKIAQKAQLLFTYTSSGKEKASRETYYVPNRLLLPSRGLDPVGQHAFVSLKTSNLIEAAESGKDIPFHGEEIFRNEDKGLFEELNE